MKAIHMGKKIYFLIFPTKKPTTGRIFTFTLDGIIKIKIIYFGNHSARNHIMLHEGHIVKVKPFKLIF